MECYPPLLHLKCSLRNLLFIVKPSIGARCCQACQCSANLLHYYISKFARFRHLSLILTTTVVFELDQPNCI